MIQETLENSQGQLNLLFDDDMMLLADVVQKWNGEQNVQARLLIHIQQVLLQVLLQQQQKKRKFLKTWMFKYKQDPKQEEWRNKQQHVVRGVSEFDTRGETLMKSLVHLLLAISKRVSLNPIQSLLCFSLVVRLVCS